MKFLNKSSLVNSMSLLPKETPRKLALLVLLQISISALDILAILLLGTTTQLGLDQVQNRIVKFPETLTGVLGIDKYNFEIQAGIISLLIVILFSTRTVFSIYSNNATFSPMVTFPDLSTPFTASMSFSLSPDGANGTLMDEHLSSKGSLFHDFLRYAAR